MSSLSLSLSLSDASPSSAAAAASAPAFSLAVPSSSSSSSSSDSPSAPNSDSPASVYTYLSSSSPSSYPPSSNQTSSHSTTTTTKLPKPQSQDPSQTLTTHALFFLLALLAGAWVIQILLPSLLVVCESIGGGGGGKTRRRRRGWGWGLKGLVLWYSSSSSSEGGYGCGCGEKYGYPPHTPGCAPANVPRDVCEDEAEEAEAYTEKRGEEGEEQEHYPKKMVRHPHHPPTLPAIQHNRNRKRNGRDRKHGHGLNLPPHVPAYYPSFMRALAVPMRMRFPDFIGGVFGSLFSRRSSSSSAKSSSSSRRNSSSRTSSSSRRTRSTNANTNANTYTLAQTLILTLYTLPLLYTTFAFGSNPLTDALRTGFVGLVQVPIAVGLAGRNGCGMVLSLVGGGGGKGGAGGPGGSWSYEKVNWLHRWVGRGVVVGVNLHCWHYFYSWTLSGTFMKNIVAPSNMWGLVGLVAVDAMFLFSLKSIRERMYGFFLATHVLGLLVLLPAIYMHKPALLTYVLVSSGLYVFDHVFRLLKTRLTHAYLTPLHGLDMTAIEIPKLNRGWRAGQHVRVCVVDPGVSSWWWGWGCGMEVHPLTIASVEGREEGMVLMCKRVGGWSGRVYDLARGACDRRNGTEGGGGGRKVRVIVEGPYGGLGNTNVASFSAAVYVCGGSGITFALAGITDLVERDLRGESRVKHIQLVWVVPDPGCLEPLLPTLADLIHRSVYTPLRISVFYTRAPTGKQPAYFDAVDASPFAAPAQTNGIHPTFVPPLALAPPLAQENSNDVAAAAATNPKQQQQHHQRHPSHTLISPVSEDAQAFARAYQQRLDQQRNARPRPPPSQRPASPYESPRAAPAPPPPSAYNPPKTKSKSRTANANGNASANPGGPQRQDSNASARTLVDTSASASGPYPRKSSLKRTGTGTSGTHPMLSSNPSAHHRLPTNLTLAPGRPKLSPFLEQALDRALRLSHSDLKDLDDDLSGDGYGYDHASDRERHGNGREGRGGKLCGVVVAVCGPAGLAEEVAGAVAGLEWERTQRVGGVEIVEEVFGC